MGSERQNVGVSNGLPDQRLSVNDDNKDSSALAIDSAVDVQPMERHLTDRIAKEMSMVVETELKVVW